tara:strand:- start:2053 stop:2364 length:312 start_codon:yes stop_codon:yes gene_type:complete
MPPLSTNDAAWAFYVKWTCKAPPNHGRKAQVLLSIFREKIHRTSALLYFSLGDFVIHPDQPDWGVGQVQSIVGMNVTVNFEHAGKQMINCNIIALNAAPRPTK